jgi:hypothetical protein
MYFNDRFIYGKVKLKPNYNYLVNLCIVFIGLCIIQPTTSLAQWSPPVRISVPGCDYYPKIIADGNILHVVYTIGFSNNSVHYVKSTNAGESWNSDILIADNVITTYMQFPQILSWGSNLMCLWNAQFRSNNVQTISYSISYDNGDTWTVPSYINLFGIACYYFAVSASDSIVNLMLTNGLSGSNIHAYIIRSTDFGRHWAAPVNLIHPWSIYGLGDQISFGNNVYFVWAGSFVDGDFPNLNLLRSTDRGHTWLPNMVIEDQQRWDQEPTMAVDEHGAIIIVWSTYNYIFMRKSYNSGEDWTQVDSIQPHYRTYPTGDVVYSEGRILIGWEDAPPASPRTDIYFYQSSNNGQTWEDGIWINRDTSTAFDPVIAASKTKIYAIWYDDRDDSLSTCGLYFSRWPENISSINDDSENYLPGDFMISQYPNPFNSQTIIQYILPTRASVSISIFDIIGRKVTGLNEGVKNPGTYQFIWNASDFASGIYFYRICAGDFVKTGNMFLLK